MSEIEALRWAEDVQRSSFDRRVTLLRDNGVWTVFLTDNHAQRHWEASSARLTDALYALRQKVEPDWRPKS